jgi:hypothetical protein
VAPDRVPQGAQQRQNGLLRFKPRPPSREQREVKVELLIGREGHPRQPRGDAVLVSDAVLQHGCIYIRSIDRCVVVWLQPDLVNRQTLAGALFVLADLGTPHVVVRVGAGIVEVWNEFDVGSASVGIEKLVMQHPMQPKDHRLAARPALAHEMAAVPVRSPMLNDLGALRAGGQDHPMVAV